MGSHGFSSCPNVSITVSTSRPPLPLCGAGYRDGKTVHLRETHRVGSPMEFTSGKPTEPCWAQSHHLHTPHLGVLQSSVTSPHTSPPHCEIPCHLGPETHGWYTGLCLLCTKHIWKSPISSNTKPKLSPERKTISLKVNPDQTQVSEGIHLILQIV